ncbi:hypothetical protein [Halosolutus gelatinilyticus]|uniref:hypothetical protein n=1 Tax=Halosolutus gelatinilyticus TaxID=2931975 RepID=UPI001FF2640F|nr:hypothetical protein [Halosolutus gelatinilyticus]
MSDDLEAGNQAWPFVNCPYCSTPISIVTVIGPTDGIAAPCGCRVSPAFFEDV